MKRLWLLAIFATTLLAADVTGKWTGTIDVDDPGGGGIISTPVRAQLKQGGSEITGSIGREEDQTLEAIQHAKLDGNRLTFEVSSSETSGLVKFVLTIDGDRLEGAMSGTMDTTPLTGKVHLTRLKP